MRTTGLVRVTVAAPHRRIDVALPEHSPVAELLPGLVQYAGDHLADEGALHGGWVLRRADGLMLDPGQTLGSHRVRDGEVLHLVPRSTEWPEMEYDDIVDAIARGAGRTGRAWTPRQTRYAGLTGGAFCVALILVALLRSTWTAEPGNASWWSLGVAFGLLFAGTAASRALGDASLGAVLGAVALPCATIGGALLVGAPLADSGVPQLLTASAVLALAGLVGLVGIADRQALFAGAVTAGLLGVLGGWLASTDALDAHHAAAVLAGALLAFSPLFGSLSIRLGRVPMPALPLTTADLVRDDPQPPRSMVYQAVVRADSLLTGLLTGSAVVAAICQLVLIRSEQTSAYWYVGLLAVGYLLRGRLYPVVRHRLPMAAVGVAGLVGLAVGPLMSTHGLSFVVPLLLVGCALVVVAGIQASTRRLSPYLGRAAELLEIVVVLAVVPVCCAVLGLYAVLRGLGG
ncbi:type VII secretion integral membrane protein EccD [Kribbella sp. ALI-6-A]|uniref:type VII secretion integral membrane protein EccD n=1 Tax=Kribbella sp. ALI-6-A TaxID=1933817 RepID=UPI00097CAA6A|nr:type VII secretion integral membrane protein EccD [Kribbella sp. ALI-6-A]ONI67122.1 type VII secretion integral membrane protein EccD [Kribbella sp. ALI-6-A]